MNGVSQAIVEFNLLAKLLRWVRTGPQPINIFWVNIDLSVKCYLCSLPLEEKKITCRVDYDTLWTIPLIKIPCNMPRMDNTNSTITCSIQTFK